jgi:hypothetical protein
MVYFRRQRYNNSPFLMLWTPSRGLSTLFNSGWWQDTQGDVLVDRGGRLYALNDGYLNSYHPSTGISTLYTGGDAWDGCLSMDYTTGRVFFGSDHRIYSYLQSTGLSTLYTATGKNPGCHGGDITHLAGSPYKTWQENTKLVVDSTTGRIYFGTDAPSQTNGEFGSWHASTGVSIVGTTFMDPGSETSNGILVDTVRNRAVFGEGWNGSPSNARLYMWGPTNGFSTIMHSGIFGSDGYAMGPHALDIGTGRVFGNSTRSQWSGPYGMYVWYEGSSGSSGCD